VALRYLLDTNILSELVRFPKGPVAIRITAVGEDAVCTNVIVAAELRFGAAKSGSTKLADRVDAILSALEILSLEEPADRRYAKLRCELTRRGHLSVRMTC